MKALSTLVLAASALGFAGAASAQFAKPEDAIKYRKNALFVMQQHYARIGAMVGGKVPFDAKAAADNAAIADTMAKPEIWKEQAKFKEGANKLQTEMGKLAAAAKTGNLDSIKTAFNATSGTCKSCHDDFRAK